jgi:hypothetical protein
MSVTIADPWASIVKSRVVVWLANIAGAASGPVRRRSDEPAAACAEPRVEASLRAAWEMIETILSSSVESPGCRWYVNYIRPVRMSRKPDSQENRSPMAGRDDLYDEQTDECVGTRAQELSHAAA